MDWNHIPETDQIASVDQVDIVIDILGTTTNRKKKNAPKNDVSKQAKQGPLTYKIRDSYRC